MKFSVIVLLEEDSDGFGDYIDTLNEIMVSTEKTFEIIIVANALESILKREKQKLMLNGSNIKAFTFNSKSPQAVCLKAGFNESKGKIIIVCGAYQQITKESFVNLINSFDSNFDLISPYREKRVDPKINQLQSRIFNKIVRIVTGSKIHDLSCTVKIFRREVLELTELYGNMYRFLPILAEQKGFKIKEVKCNHYQEYGETGIYKISDYLTRLLDIFTLYFNTKFSKKPLRLFSMIGFVFMLLGMSIASIILFQRLFLNVPIGNRPVLLISFLFIVLGVQAASTGLLGEIIAFTHGRKKKEYTIEKMI